MIFITLKPWKEVPGITHVRTIWEISDTENFANILESTDSRQFLESYFSDIFVPVGSTYYARATRVFNNGSRTQLEPIPVVNYGNDENSMLLGDDVSIEAPFVYVTYEDIMANTSKLKVTTSEFRCSSDDHAYTHWIVTDGTGAILYCKLYDKVNKTSIEMDNNYVFKNKSTLNFMAIHGSNTGIESPVGKKIINLTSDYNFEVNNGLSWVEPLKDFKVVFTPIDPDKPMNIFKVELLDYATEAVLMELENDNNSFLIPFYFLKEGVKYKLKIYAYDKELRYSNVYKELHVANLTNTIVRDPNYKYLDKLDVYTNYNSTLPKTPIHSEALFNMQMMIPMLDKTVGIWTSSDTKLEHHTGLAEGLKVLNDNPVYTLIKPITKGLILLDTPDANNRPTFMLYSYSNNDNVFTFQNSLTRNDETVCLGKTNAIVQISTTEFIYNPVGTNKLRLWNIETNKIENLEDIPIENYTKGIMIRMGSNSVLLANGNDYTTKVYDYESKAYRSGIVFGPNSFIGADLRTMPLINGDALIVKTNKIKNDTEDSIVIYRYKETKFETVGVKFTNDIFPDITVTCGYGHCHMAKFLPGNQLDKTQDRYDIKVYL